jgi:hypothetical protein
MWCMHPRVLLVGKVPGLLGQPGNWMVREGLRWVMMGVHYSYYNNYIIYKRAEIESRWLI